MRDIIYGNKKAMIVEAKVIEIARRIEDQFLSTANNPNDISIFLCGGKDKQEVELRKRLRTRISAAISKYRYRVYFPEDMFVELILGHQRHDLLSLENLLADSVNAVAILLQSPGTFTELGAFANHDKLKDKLIIVVNPKYAHVKSFINLGPIRYLRRKSKSKVLFCQIKLPNLDNLAKRISDSAREITKFSLPKIELTNPIATYEFYLALIYVFDPIPLTKILEIATMLSGSTNKSIVSTAAQTVINTLISEQKITYSAGVLSTTPQGVNTLIYNNRTKKNINKISTTLTELRVKTLNLTLRKNYYKKCVGQSNLVELVT